MNPEGRRVWTFAPAPISACTTGACPSAAAHISAVWPRDSSLASTVAPAASRALSDRQRAGPRGGHQRCLAAGKRRVGIGARLQQQVNDRGIAVGAGQRQGRDAVATGRLHVGAGFHQQLGHFAIVVIRRPVQRGHAVDLRRVHIGALLDQGRIAAWSIFSAASASGRSGAAWTASRARSSEPASHSDGDTTATATHRSSPCCRRTRPCARRRVRAA